MATRITEVRDQRSLDQFIGLPWTIYPGRHPHWVPPLRSERRAFLDPRKNPFFDFAEVRLFLAHSDAGTPLCRLAAVVNPRHNQTHGDRVGFFGLFECVDDPAVAGALLDAAGAFVRSRGLTSLRGPVSLSLNDEAGLLVDGFDQPPMILMPYNPPYYEALILAHGFEPAMTLFAYAGDVGDGVPGRLERGAGLARSRRSFTLRPLRLDDFDAEVRRVHALYTAAWADNWGAVPMTEREFHYLARQLRPVIDPNLCYLAEVDGQPAGFSLALPDFNQALCHANGRLFPLGWLHILRHRHRIDAVRIITLGVLKSYRHLGIDACFYAETYRHALAKGIRRGEASWILETNIPMRRALEKMGLSITKTYRLYDRAL
ncbi:MAG: N-acetyltransferase family protein [Verrucomicrobiales bacterium]